MDLTFRNRVKICFEVMTKRSGHKHIAKEKCLSTFIRGYQAGRLDTVLEIEQIKDGEKKGSIA
jgi:hypothetical protein